MSRAHELAWGAGFFDGEGWITIGRRNQRFNGKQYTGYYLRIGINHVAPEPIYEFHRIFGGKVEYSNNIIGNRKPRYRWLANTDKAKNILIQLMPYFRNKNRAAEIALEFQKTIKDEYKNNGVPDNIKLYRELLKNELVLVNAKD